MAWTTPRTWVASETVTASLFNTHIRDNNDALRTGALAIASQANNDFIYCSSSTQIGRLAAVANRVPRWTGAAWEMHSLPSQTAWPIGSIFEAVVSTNPNTLLGFGVWTAFGTGRVMVAIDATQTEFDTNGETGGSKTHTITTAEIPVHTHLQNAHTHTQNSHSHNLSSIGNTVSSEGAGGTSCLDNSGTKSTSTETATNIATTATNQAAGGGTSHSNLMPYIVVYRWKRDS